MLSQSLPEQLRRVVAHWGNAPAILGEEVWTYRRLAERSQGLAAGLLEIGLSRGDRVALLCPNGAEFVVAYLALLEAGATVVPINLLLNPSAIAYQLKDCGCRGLIAHAAMAENAAAALEQTPGISLVVGIGGDLGRGALSMDALMRSPSDAPLEIAEAADAVILYTSGTTGHPKGAILTHANLAANAQAVAQVLEFRPGQERVLVVLPMFHAFAATVGILTPLLCGAALIPVPRFDPQLITDAVEAHQATLFLGVPSLYALLLRQPPAQRERWRSVRLCISGGAAMAPPLMAGFEQAFGVPILEGDGPTECGPVTCVNPPAGPRKPGSVGPPIPGVEMRICDAGGRELARGEYGEVCVRGPSVMRGYWNLPEATASSFHGDWFRTGDLGWVDADGWFYLVDRIKDLIITNGMNVYPRVVEEALLRHPAVAEAAVVGEPHATHGEIVIAHVVPAPQANVDAAELKGWCREHLGRHEQPRRIELREAMPKNAAGKILKRELRRAGEIERGVGPAQPTA
jgi:long-chain acyl-CoA synthetase